MIDQETKFREAAVFSVAEKMALAARTAPKGKGIDLLDIIVVKDASIKKLSDKMKAIGEKESHPTFLRDSENVLSALAVVVIGTKRKTIGLRYCGFCGHATCADAEKAGALCAYNPGDLGIAVGSAAAIAADNRVDNRIMYTAGKAAIELGFLEAGVVIAYGIPLSVSSKNPFFDRK